MKIFYYFSDLETNMYNWQRVHFIDELIRHGIEFEIFNPLFFKEASEANERALQILKNGGYSLFFTNICYYKMLYIETILEIKKLGIPTLCLRYDNLVIPYTDKVLAKYFDLVWLTSKETQHLYDNWGVNSFFAPYAANPFTFNYIGNNLLRKICFVGTPYGSRSLMINALTTNGIAVDAFCVPRESKNIETKEGSKLLSRPLTPSRIETYISDLRFKEGRRILYGSIVNRIKGKTFLAENEFLNKKFFVEPSEISSVYSKYMLCLSSTSANHTDILDKPLNIVNLRAFEIPMSGGINICRFCNELADYFEEGKEIIFYKDNIDLIDKARYFSIKATDAEIIRIKKAARLRAENEHTWWNRFSIAFRILGFNIK